MINLGGMIATEFHEQTDVKLTDFVDGRFTLGFWLEPGFRVNNIQVRNASSMTGVTLAVGDGGEAARFGAAVVSGDVWQDLGDPPGSRVVLDRLRATVTADDVDEEAARFGSFDLRFYGWRVD